MRPDVEDIPEPPPEDLIRYLLATSANRARIIGELSERNPGMAEILMDLEADDDLRVRFEMVRWPRRTPGIAIPRWIPCREGALRSSCGPSSPTY